MYLHDKKIYSISKRKRIPRFFWELSHTFKQSIQGGFSPPTWPGYEVRSIADSSLGTRPFHTEGGLVNLHWVWLQHLADCGTTIAKGHAEVGKIIRYIGGKSTTAFHCSACLLLLQSAVTRLFHTTSREHRCYGYQCPIKANKPLWSQKKIEKMRWS